MVNIPPIHGDLGDGLFLLYLHYFFFMTSHDIQNCKHVVFVIPLVMSLITTCLKITVAQLSMNFGNPINHYFGDFRQEVQIRPNYRKSH